MATASALDSGIQVSGKESSIALEISVKWVEGNFKWNSARALTRYASGM